MAWTGIHILTGKICKKCLTTALQVWGSSWHALCKCSGGTCEVCAELLGKLDAGHLPAAQCGALDADAQGFNSPLGSAQELSPSPLPAERQQGPAPALLHISSISRHAEGAGPC